MKWKFTVQRVTKHTETMEVEANRWIDACDEIKSTFGEDDKILDAKLLSLENASDSLYGKTWIWNEDSVPMVGEDEFHYYRRMEVAHGSDWRRVLGDKRPIFLNKS